MTTEGIDPAMHALSQTPHNVPARSPVDDALDRLEKALTVYAYARDFQQERDDLATVRRSLEQLREERDEYAERLAWHREERDAYLKGNLWVTRAAEEQSRAEAAEAENRRLTEGLREIAALDTRYGQLFYRAREKARALLSANPTDGDGAK